MAYNNDFNAQVQDAIRRSLDMYSRSPTTKRPSSQAPSPPKPNAIEPLQALPPKQPVTQQQSAPQPSPPQPSPPQHKVNFQRNKSSSPRRPVSEPSRRFSPPSNTNFVKRNVPHAPPQRAAASPKGKSDDKEHHTKSQFPQKRTISPTSTIFSHPLGLIKFFQSLGLIRTPF